MATVTRLFYPTTVTQISGEGGISTGLNPLDWGPLGPTIASGSSDVAGTTITRVGAFTGYTYQSGDTLVIISGSAGTVTGTYNISGKVSDNAVTITASLGSSKTSLVGYIVRGSLLGALTNVPTSLPAPDASPSDTYDDFACVRPQDASLLQGTKILQLGTWKQVDTGIGLATVLATDNPSSITSVGVGFRYEDVPYNGAGNLYAARLQLRNNSGPFGATVNNTSIVYDGGVGPSGDKASYVQPGLIDTSLTATAAQLSDSLAVNLQLQQSSGDAVDASSLMGVNGFVLELVYDVGSGSIYAGDRVPRLGMGGAFRNFTR